MLRRVELAFSCLKEFYVGMMASPSWNSPQLFLLPSKASFSLLVAKNDNFCLALKPYGHRLLATAFCFTTAVRCPTEVDVTCDFSSFKVFCVEVYSTPAVTSCVVYDPRVLTSGALACVLVASREVILSCYLVDHVYSICAGGSVRTRYPIV